MLALWEHAVAAGGDETCIHYFDAAISYRDADLAASALAGALSDGGLEAGARVGILLQNDPQCH
jgi:long-chain acyl-CoA synthetase